ncbi:MAG TPA: sigma-70 family RNA polymerase sigma factor [Planctomycetota bacterium]|nr:sigma-70 family RNA polymerase sigma factor [Planctomycetota bacterium]
MNVADEKGLERFLPGLRAAAERLAGPGEAEDLLQDCLAAALPALPRLKDEALLGAWLRQILRRRWIDRLRRRVLERRVREDLRPAAAHDAPFDDHERVRAALGELDDEERRLLEWRFFESATSVDIARRLGRPPGTVRSMIFNALRRFEAEFQKLCREDSE